jgi:hypothetical protein
MRVSSHVRRDHNQTYRLVEKNSEQIIHATGSTHESNRLAVHEPERHEPLPDQVPREVRHARGCDDANKIRGGRGDEPC